MGPLPLRPSFPGARCVRLLESLAARPCGWLGAVARPSFPNPLGHRHITVNTLAPGPFASKMMKVTLARAQEEIEAGTALGRIGSSEVLGVGGKAGWREGRGRDARRRKSRKVNGKITGPRALLNTLSPVPLFSLSLGYGRSSLVPGLAGRGLRDGRRTGRGRGDPGQAPTLREKGRKEGRARWRREGRRKRNKNPRRCGSRAS